MQNFVSKSTNMDACWTHALPASLVLLLWKQKPRKDDSPSASRAIHQLTLPFVLAVFGSILGCSAFYYTPAAAACLLASYVGGSVNLGATARIIGATPETISVLVAADLVVMALYWAGTSRVLHGQKQESSSSQVETKSEVELLLTRIIAMTGVSILALALVCVANVLDGRLAGIVPGTACAWLALAAPLLARYVPHSWRQNGPSNFAFLLVFGSMGLSLDVSSTLAQGPATLFLAAGALVIHLVTVLGLGRLVFQLPLLDLLVASQAAIGGPATAATLCAQCGATSLVTAATVWGVVGYAMGTTLGVTAFRMWTR